MTLDDAINYYDGIAKEYRANADIKRNDYMDLRGGAFEAEQLASWLNELKLLRERIEKHSEPYEDFISRREAIKKFAYNCRGERIPDYDCDNFPVQIDIKKVKEILRDLPLVSPQPNTGYWIDVNERLPENRNQEVLISLEWGIDIGSYSDGEWHSEWINHYDDGNVLAWMPLPPCYKPQESEDKYGNV